MGMSNANKDRGGAGSRMHFARVDATRTRREAIARAETSGEWSGITLTHAEWAEWMDRHGYIRGVWCRGEGMGEE